MMPFIPPHLPAGCLRSVFWYREASECQTRSTGHLSAVEGHSTGEACRPEREPHRNMDEAGRTGTGGYCTVAYSNRLSGYIPRAHAAGERYQLVIRLLLAGFRGRFGGCVGETGCITLIYNDYLPIRPTMPRLCAAAGRVRRTPWGLGWAEGSHPPARRTKTPEFSARYVKGAGLARGLARRRVEGLDGPADCGSGLREDR